MGSITQRGDVWRAQVRRAGERSMSRSFDTKTAATAWMAKMEAPEPEPVVAGPVTVADLMDRYSREKSPAKAGGRWEVYRLLALAPTFKVEAARLDRPFVANWRDHRLTQVSPGTVNREMNLLSEVIRHAISEWQVAGLEVNPFLQIKRPKQPPHRTRRVSDDERAAIILELGWDGISQPDDLLAWVAWGFCFALETMMRKGEVLNMTWRHVHPKKVHLPKTKNGDTRDVPLNSAARALLTMLTPGEPDARVCPVEAGTFGAYFSEAVKGAAIENLHFHDARREALSRTSKRLSILELMKSVGHRDTRSLGIYYETDADELADKLG